MQTKQTRVLLFTLVAASAALALAPKSRAADAPDAIIWSKPAWLSELSFAVKESHDDNVFGVSGLGMPVQSSWVDSVSAKITFNLIPLLDDQKDVTALSLTYNPESVRYEDATTEDYIAHRINAVAKGKFDGGSYSLENAYLYNDGDRYAPTYALNQLAGAAANQNDKFRNNYAHSLARERRNQSQDRYNFWVQFNDGNVFFRPVSSLTQFNLNTFLFNTGAAPYKGYQDYVSRYDVNAGADVGVKITPDFSFFVGYRDGYQHQDQFALAINSDRHFSSNQYQRALLGIEGKPVTWLTLKLVAGPDYKDFNANAAVANSRTTRAFIEGTASAALPDNQSLTLGYKQYMFVASTGLVPYVDTTATLVYHVNATKEIGIDLGIKYLEANYTMGNDVAGSAPSRRDDLDKGASAGVTYAFTKKLSVGVTYTYDKGSNGLGNLPANLFAAYRDFDHNVVSASIQYKF